MSKRSPANQIYIALKDVAVIAWDSLRIQIFALKGIHMRLAITLMSLLATHALANSAYEKAASLQKSLTQKLSSYEGDYVLASANGKTAGYKFQSYGGPAIWLNDSSGEQKEHTKQDELDLIASSCPETVKARIDRETFEIRSGSEGNYINSINLEVVAYNQVKNYYNTSISENGNRLSISKRSANNPHASYSVFTFDADSMIIEKNFDGYTSSLTKALLSPRTFVKCAYRLQR